MKKRTFVKTTLLGLAALALPKKVSALEYYPNGSDMKWAVLYSTWCGSSRDAGVWISEGMDGIANVFDVRENPDLSGYENIVVGGSIRSGVTSDAMQEYLKRNAGLLKSKIRGLYVVCGNRMQAPGPEQTTSLIDNHLAKLCGVTSVPSKVFLGRITMGLLDTSSKEMMTSMNMPEYDNLKREDCMAFGREVLGSI
jgi:menaquinone-dependent protoporphyrinogen IX oxidase